MKRQLFFSVVAIVLLSAVPALPQVILLQEDFEGLPLGPFINETAADPGTIDPSQVWTNVPPEGWEIEDVTPLGGVADWRAWSFANRNAWSFVAGDQRRSEFTKGVGTIAVVDPDEWDDREHEPGTYNSFMNTPPIDISSALANSVELQFDSSWRPEDNQAALLTVSYDGGPEQDVFFWTSFPDGPFFKDDNSTNETLVFPLENPDGASEMVLSFQMLDAGNDWWWAIDNIFVTSEGNTLFAEDFEGLELGPFQDENLPDNVNEIDPDKVWTATPPGNWQVEFDGLEGGITEWMGWSFANSSAWANVDDQRRSEFTRGTGTIAVADPDEYDDGVVKIDPDQYNTNLISPPIDLSNSAPNALEVTFDSSWRPEDNQKARLVAIYDGTRNDVFVWTSDANSPDFKNDESTNETLTFDLNNPEGASELVLSFEMFDAGNDWWWAIDNVRVVDRSQVPQQGPARLPFVEDFEGLVLGDSVEEEVAASAVWTKTPPPGWMIDDSGVVGANQGLGVDEWIGWSFADKNWWAQTAGDQQRTQFTNGSGTVAVADPDEWDDIDSPGDQGVFTSFLSTPQIALENAAPNSVVLTFDSSWRDEDTQAANITVSYDGGAPVEVLRWSSDPNSPNFHNDFPNESVTVPLNNPAGASTVVVSFGMLDATNDWWWAIDNINISTGTGIGEWSLY